MFAGSLHAVFVQVEVKKAVTKAELRELKPMSTSNELACVPRPPYPPLYQQGVQ